MKELRLKNASLAEDLNHNSLKLESRENMIKEITSVVSKKKEECKEMASQIEKYSTSVAQLNRANTDLQHVVVGHEEALATVKVRQTKWRYFMFIQML